MKNYKKRLVFFNTYVLIYKCKIEGNAVSINFSDS